MPRLMTILSTLFLLALVVYYAASFSSSSIAHSATASDRPTARASSLTQNIPANASQMTGKYIVVFKTNTPIEVLYEAIKQCEAAGGKIKHKYESVMIGFAAEMPDDVLTSLNTNEHLDYIEADGEVSILAKGLGIGKK